MMGNTITQYNSDEPHRHPEFDPSCLEETNQGALPYDLLYSVQLLNPAAVLDIDGDGYREVDQETFEQAVKAFGMEKRPFPLAPFFDDRRTIAGPSSNGIKERLSGIWNAIFGAEEDGTAAVESPIEDRLAYLPEGLQEATDRHDFPAARAYFSRRAEEGADLKTLSLSLAAHLAASAMHAGLNIDDGVLLEGPTGFSVSRDGRLRFDCGQYAQLAHSDLSDVPGISFSYVVLQKSEEAGPIQDQQPPLGYQNASLQCYNRDGCFLDLKHQIPLLRRNEADLGTRYKRLAIYTRRTFTDEEGLGMKRPHDEIIRVRKGTVPPGTRWQYRGDEIVSYRGYSWTRDDLTKTPQTSFNVPESFVQGVTELFRKPYGDLTHMWLDHNEAGAPSYSIKLEDERRMKGAYDRVVYRLFLPNNDQPFSIYATSFGTRSVSFDVPLPSSADDTGAHMIGIASNGAAHLVIDNHTVELVETDDIWGWIRERYGSQYEIFSRRPTYLDQRGAVSF